MVAASFTRPWPALYARRYNADRRSGPAWRLLTIQPSPPTSVGTDGQRPDAEVAAADRNDAPGRQLIGQRTDVGEQEPALVLGGERVSGPEQDQ